MEKGADFCSVGKLGLLMTVQEQSAIHGTTYRILSVGRANPKSEFHLRLACNHLKAPKTHAWQWQFSSIRSKPSCYYWTPNLGN